MYNDSSKLKNCLDDQPAMLADGDMAAPNVQYEDWILLRNILMNSVRIIHYLPNLNKYNEFLINLPALLST